VHLVLVGARFGLEIVEKDAQHVANGALHRHSRRLVDTFPAPPLRRIPPPRSR
jgi:hypothetical protein